MSKMENVAQSLDIDDYEVDENNVEVEDDFQEDFDYLVTDVKSTVQKIDEVIETLHEEMTTDPEEEFETDEDGEAKSVDMKMKFYKLKCAETIGKLINSKQKYASHLMDLHAKKKSIEKKHQKPDQETTGDGNKQGMTREEIMQEQREIAEELKKEKQKALEESSSELF